MTRYPAVPPDIAPHRPLGLARRGLLVFVIGLILTWLSACAPRLDEQQVRARLVEQLRLQDNRLRVVTITKGTMPVASIDYAGVRADIRFRRQADVWVIDALGQDGRWEPADRPSSLARSLTEKARATWVQSEMPRYARTLKLLVGWTELLSMDCPTALPISPKALVDLHAVWHRQLFPNRGGEFHNFDLFVRDAWWKPLRLTLTSARVAAQSGGADGRMDTGDDVLLVFARKPARADVVYCVPRYTMPALVAEALGNPSAPKEWNCSEIVKALRTGDMLDLVADRK